MASLSLKLQKNSMTGLHLGLLLKEQLLTLGYSGFLFTSHPGTLDGFCSHRTYLCDGQLLVWLVFWYVNSLTFIWCTVGSPSFTVEASPQVLGCLVWSGMRTTRRYRR